MRKILLGLILTGFALIVFISVGPQANNFFVHPEAPAADPSEGQLSFEPAAYFSVVQGGSAPAAGRAVDTGGRQCGCSAGV